MFLDEAVFIRLLPVLTSLLLINYTSQATEISVNELCIAFTVR